MGSAGFLLLFMIQAQILGIFIQSCAAKRVFSRLTGGSQDIYRLDPTGGFRTGQRSAERQEERISGGGSDAPLRISVQEETKLQRPGVKPPRGSPSATAKEFWNQFMFRGKSDVRYVIPFKNVEVRQETCHVFTFSQKFTHENCETLELQNSVCLGKCDMALSGGGDCSGPCALCSPAVTTSKTLKLKCKDKVEKIKVVKIIEDCGCRTKEG